MNCLKDLLDLELYILTDKYKILKYIAPKICLKISIKIIFNHIKLNQFIKFNKTYSNFTLLINKFYILKFVII